MLGEAGHYPILTLTVIRPALGMAMHLDTQLNALFDTCWKGAIAVIITIIVCVPCGREQAGAWLAMQG